MVFDIIAYGKRIGGEEIHMSNCSNTKACACTYPGCPRHGKCCECIAHHAPRNEATGCMFSKEGEAKYNRSLKALFEDKKMEM